MHKISFSKNRINGVFILSAITLALSTIVFNAHGQDKPSSVDESPLNSQQVENIQQKSLVHTEGGDVAKDKLLATLTGFKTLTSLFEQTVKDEDGNVLQKGSGQFSLAKPNLLHWQTNEPDESTIVSNGETLWLYDPFIEQASALSLEASINNTPILLLMNQDQAVWDEYTVELVDDNSFKIISKNLESQVQSLDLTFNQGVLSQFAIFDATGQISEFTLNNSQVNADLDASLFEFTLPEGAVLDDQR